MFFQKTESTYFLSRIEARITFVVIFDSKKAERDSYVQNFIVDISSSLRLSRLLQSLKSGTKWRHRNFRSRFTKKWRFFQKIYFYKTENMFKTNPSKQLIWKKWILTFLKQTANSEKIIPWVEISRASPSCKYFISIIDYFVFMLLWYWNMNDNYSIF